MRLNFLFLLFMTAVNVGSFELPSPYIYGADLLNGYMMLIAFRNWRPVPKVMNPIIGIWVLLALYIAFLAVNSEFVINKSTLAESLRELYPFGLFFYILSLLRDEEFYKYINYLHVLSVIGCILSILQSLHGTDPLFPPEGFYNRGHADGQNYMINAWLARVALPTLYITQMMFLYNVYRMMLGEVKMVNVFLFLLYAVSILIGFSRSSWAGLVICIVFALILFLLIKKEIFQRAVSFILVSVVLLLIVLNTINTPVVENIRKTLTERVEEMFYDIEKKDGNLGSRLSTIDAGMKLFSNNPLTGIDLKLVALTEMYQITDVGYLYALLTTGIIGLALLSLWYVVAGIIAYSKMMAAGRKQDYEKLIFSMLLLTNIIFFIIIQQTNQFTFATCCFAITAGLFINIHRPSASDPKN